MELFIQLSKSNLQNVYPSVHLLKVFQDSGLQINWQIVSETGFETGVASKDQVFIKTNGSIAFKHPDGTRHIEKL